MANEDDLRRLYVPQYTINLNGGGVPDDFGICDQDAFSTSVEVNDLTYILSMGVVEAFSESSLSRVNFALADGVHNADFRRLQEEVLSSFSTKPKVFYREMVDGVPGCEFDGEGHTLGEEKKVAHLSQDDANLILGFGTFTPDRLYLDFDEDTYLSFFNFPSSTDPKEIAEGVYAFGESQKGVERGVRLGGRTYDDLSQRYGSIEFIKHAHLARAHLIVPEDLAFPGCDFWFGQAITMQRANRSGGFLRDIEEGIYACTEHLAFEREAYEAAAEELDAVLESVNNMRVLGCFNGEIGCLELNYPAVGFGQIISCDSREHASVLRRESTVAEVIQELSDIFLMDGDEDDEVAVPIEGIYKVLDIS